MNKLNHNEIRKNIRKLKIWDTLNVCLILCFMSGVAVVFLGAIFEIFAMMIIGLFLTFITLYIESKFSPKAIFDNYDDYNYLEKESIEYFGYNLKREDVIEVGYRLFGEEKTIKYNLYESIYAFDDDELNYEQIYLCMNDEMCMHEISISELAKVMKISKKEMQSEIFKEKVESLWV